MALTLSLSKLYVAFSTKGTGAKDPHVFAFYLSKQGTMAVPKHFLQFILSPNVVHNEKNSGHFTSR